MVDFSTAVFGWRLYRLLSATGAFATATGGSIISPLSCFIALLLALNGAGPSGNTHQQLFSALTQTSMTPISPQPPVSGLAGGWLADESALNTNVVQHLAQLVASSNTANWTRLVVANAVWTNHTALLPAYVTAMRELYGAPATAVRNAAPINAWAKNVTNGLITKAVPPSLKFKALLTNAIYFNGAWDWPFDAKYTRQDTFTTDKGASVQVQMMFQIFTAGPMAKSVGPTSDDDAVDRRPVMFLGPDDDDSSKSLPVTGVRLPYKGSDLSCVLLLPSAGTSAEQLMLTLGPELLFDKRWRARTFYLRAPRFKVKLEATSFRKALQLMGVKAAFTDRADLSRMSAEPMLIKDVMQSVTVVFNEVGTEAAAVTTVVTGPTSMPPMLTLDRPFVFAIVDETQLVLFLGVVNDPSAGTR